MLGNPFLSLFATLYNTLEKPLNQVLIKKNKLKNFEKRLVFDYN